MSPKDLLGGWVQPALTDAPGPPAQDVQALVTRGLSHSQWVDQVVRWAHRGGWRCYAMADSRTQHWGTDTGWPDVFCADAVGLGRQALGIECKTGSGRERPDQAAWRAALSLAGVHCLVAYPAEGEYVRHLLLDGVPLSAQVRQDTISKSFRKARDPRRPNVRGSLRRPTRKGGSRGPS